MNRRVVGWLLVILAVAIAAAIVESFIGWAIIHVYIHDHCVKVPGGIFCH